MRFIDLFWFFLDNDKSGSQIIAEKNQVNVSSPFEKELGQEMDALDLDEFEILCDNDFLE